ncbi:TetR/AcrR family transcriptional regulator [Desulfosudis oleivorans]|uniref:Transcriptional regulator, TetR family n=1 Tax=Desulfosudis oleivorans (strain DSM 6200 / JCM 39069 / Hxd3) TaxID=96561 RepID=A8ZST1_DESOH|nr:TetR/AcrR family transcriptional regulator [Desulfosudis oleivorans]ABW65994.1 transcriptional regulator, TetR family [Desulfosudis oleivorans Hxd3]
MSKKNVILEKSGGRKFDLYAEVGKYFSSAGQLDEIAFKQALHEKLKALKDGNPPDGFIQPATEWLSGYLNEILNYLREKGISEPALKLFKIAINESSLYGLENISVSVDCLQHIVSELPEPQKTPVEKKGAADEMRQRIFAAAIDVFAEDGFHRATIDKVSETAGIGKGSVYRHFKSKEEILDELLRKAFQEVVERISTITSKDIDILQMVQEMIESWILFISNNHKLYRIIQTQAMYGQTGRTVMFYDYVISRLPLFKERLVSLNRDKELKTTNLYTVFYGIMGFIDGVVQKWFRCGMDYSLIDEVPVILEVLFNGFVGEKTTRTVFFIPPEKD